jgi:hypothetical protein
MILAGAALFSGALYALAITHVGAVAVLAPMGGITLISGWLVLAFANPAQNPGETSASPSKSRPHRASLGEKSEIAEELCSR